MKRIYFFLENRTSLYRRLSMVFKFLKHGVPTRFLKCSEAGSICTRPDTLLCTDSPGVYRTLRANGNDALICIDQTGAMDLFPEGKYFVMDAANAEFDYFERIHRRFHNIPWEILRTKNLVLRESIEDDVEDFVRIYSEPGMTDYTEELYKDPGEERNYIKEYREKVYAVQGFGIWTVLHKKTGRVIGRAGLSARAGFEGVEVGFVIEKAMQNKGYATEAVSAVTKLAGKLEFDRVFAIVIPENLPSVRVLEKCGYRPESRTCLENKEYDVFTYCPLSLSMLKY